MTCFSFLSFFSTPSCSVAGGNIVARSLTFLFSLRVNDTREGLEEERRQARSTSLDGSFTSALKRGRAHRRRRIDASRNNEDRVRTRALRDEIQWLGRGRGRGEENLRRANDPGISFSINQQHVDVCSPPNDSHGAEIFQTIVIK